MYLTFYDKSTPQQVKKTKNTEFRLVFFFQRCLCLRKKELPHNWMGHWHPFIICIYFRLYCTFRKSKNSKWKKKLFWYYPLYNTCTWSLKYVSIFSLLLFAKNINRNGKIKDEKKKMHCKMWSFHLSHFSWAINYHRTLLQVLVP